MRYVDRVVVVTGGSRGIGEGIVRAFVAEGARVIAVSNDREGGAALAAALGPTCAHACADVRSEDALAATLADVLDAHGRLDCLVNNAGTHLAHRPIDAITPEQLRGLLELNFVSQFVACRLALPALRRSSGCIINMASLVASIGQEHAVDYVATKGAIVAFTRALAIDEARHGVRVNSVSPGNIDTPLWRSFADASADPKAMREEGAAAQWLPRLGTIDEVGRLCVYLAAEATYTTGVDHVISGGAELGYGRKTPNA
ncbi:General stress protein 39 [Luteitalea pratensis]|uniref:General stress protein 39 n=1 Tax=Luteitalea pratensis TaxID=1855912 RepID=A0A143PWF2_LUTPR|nr:SDR family oxidoreductase [Luteitalea pratensis]AMY12538.1 General stress protein 39 [Luteitalea pratensis]